MLWRVVERARRAQTASVTAVATSVDPQDDPIADFCSQMRVPVIRGSHYDVLDRYHFAAQQLGADLVIRITADCPLIDPGLVDDAATVLMESRMPSMGDASAAQAKYDLVANRLPPPWKRTFPIGLDVEVCTMEALERAWSEAQEPAEREHVLPYVYTGLQVRAVSPTVSVGVTPNGFRIGILNCKEDLGRHRWTVDTAQDLEFVREVYRALGSKKEFSWRDVLELLHDRPELVLINAGVRHNTVEDVDRRGLKGPEA